jgi:hypothetical protein
LQREYPSQIGQLDTHQTSRNIKGKASHKIISDGTICILFFREPGELTVFSTQPPLQHDP